MILNKIALFINLDNILWLKQTEKRGRQRDFHKERSNRSVINMLIIWGYLGESVNGQSVVYFEPLTMIFLWIKSGVWRYG